MGNVANVYIAYDAGDNVLYVGMTKRQITRIDEHRERSAWWPLVRRVEIEHHPTPAEAAARESELIRTLQPAFNVKGTASRVDLKIARRAARRRRAREAEPSSAAPVWHDRGSRGGHRRPRKDLVISALRCACLPRQRVSRWVSRTPLRNYRAPISARRELPREQPQLRAPGRSERIAPYGVFIIR